MKKDMLEKIRYATNPLIQTVMETCDYLDVNDMYVLTNKRNVVVLTKDDVYRELPVNSIVINSGYDYRDDSLVNADIFLAIRPDNSIVIKKNLNSVTRDDLEHVNHSEMIVEIKIGENAEILYNKDEMKEDLDTFYNRYGISYHNTIRGFNKRPNSRKIYDQNVKNNLLNNIDIIRKSVNDIIFEDRLIKLTIGR